MTLQFTKATKQKAKLRGAFFGPSGSGKTFSALRIATGMGGKIALIDTEYGSASKYADRFDFDTLDLPDYNIDTYIAALDAAAAAGYNVLIIDSLTHGWHELINEVERLAHAKYRGNTWSAWSEGTPKQKRFVNALLAFPGHVIATIRSKTEWTTDQSGNGKSRPTRVGLAPEQGKGIEYEFDFLLELSTEHLGNVIKDRTGKFQDTVIDKPGEEFGKALVAWLNEGSEPQAKPAPPTPSSPNQSGHANPQPTSNGGNGNARQPVMTPDERKAATAAIERAFRILYPNAEQRNQAIAKLLHFLSSKSGREHRSLSDPAIPSSLLQQASDKAKRQEADYASGKDSDEARVQLLVQRGVNQADAEIFHDQWKSDLGHEPQNGDTLDWIERVVIAGHYDAYIGADPA